MDEAEFSETQSNEAQGCGTETTAVCACCRAHADNPDSNQVDSIQQVLQSEATTLNINYTTNYQDGRQYHEHITNIHDCEQLELIGGDVVSQLDTSYKTESTTPNSDEANQSNLVSSGRTLSTKREQEAIEKVRRTQDETREDDLMIQGISILAADIPTVHPRMVEVSFYEGGAVPQDEEYQPSTTGTKQVIHRGEIKFDELLTPRGDRRFISLIGFPGAGKTTLSKRLAKSAQLTCFHMKFMKMNYADDYKLTPKELLLDKAYPKLDKETCNYAFEWVKNNENQCVLIMDGYDQSEWTLNENAPKENYDSPQNIRNIVANICNKHFFPTARLVFTSRPHSMITVPPSMKPDLTILLQDLSYDDMKILFFAYSGKDFVKAESLWHKLNMTAPQLITICHNPLILQFVVRASLHPSPDIGEVTTMTRVFATVLANLRRSSFTRHEDILTLREKLARLAYKCTSCNTVVIKLKQLKEEGLDCETVQDLIIALHGHIGYTSKVFEGDTKLFFSHQTLQEYFAADYVKNQMPLSEFKDFVKSKLFLPHWSMVRRFLMGQLVDMNAQKVDMSEVVTRYTASMVNVHQNEDAAGINFWRGFRRCICCETSDEEAEFGEAEHGRFLAKGARELDNDEEYQDASAQLLPQLDEDMKGNEQEKIEIVVAAVTEQIPSSIARGLVEICVDIRECNNDDITAEAAKYFPAEAILTRTPLSASDVHALSYVLRKVTKHLKVLNLWECQVDTHSFSHVCSAIREMPGTIGLLGLSDNSLTSDAVEMICECLDKITDWMWITGSFIDGEGIRRCPNDEERETLQQALNQLEHSDLLICVDEGVLLRKES